MLQRISSIKNVGRFKNCVAIGDVSLRRFTLIFAENGRGKTTLCAILRSLFTNIPALIIGRRTLGTVDAQEIQFLTTGGTIWFRNGAWTAAFPNIAVSTVRMSLKTSMPAIQSAPSIAGIFTVSSSGRRAWRWPVG